MHTSTPQHPGLYNISQGHSTGVTVAYRNNYCPPTLYGLERVGYKLSYNQPPYGRPNLQALNDAAGFVSQQVSNSNSNSPTSSVSANGPTGSFSDNSPATSPPALTVSHGQYYQQHPRGNRFYTSGYSNNPQFPPPHFLDIPDIISGEGGESTVHGGSSSQYSGYYCTPQQLAYHHAHANYHSISNQRVQHIPQTVTQTYQYQQTQQPHYNAGHYHGNTMATQREPILASLDGNRSLTGIEGQSSDDSDDNLPLLQVPKAKVIEFLLFLTFIFWLNCV